MISNLIKKLEEKTDLTYDEVNGVMIDILSGKTTDVENVAFLSNLAEKGETDDELLGMLDKMNEFALKVVPKNQGTIIDMCGTGGDKLQTFNVSTTASFVVAAAGGIVAKHGNRSSSGISGSADIFEYFGYNLDQSPFQIAFINTFSFLKIHTRFTELVENSSIPSSERTVIMFSTPFLFIMSGSLSRYSVEKTPTS